MDTKKWRKLQAKGWAQGDARDFLGLSDEEAALVNTKVALARLLIRTRKAEGMTQAQLAELLGSSQPRVAKMEGGGQGVTIDLLMRALLKLGKTTKQIGSAVARVA